MHLSSYFIILLTTILKLTSGEEAKVKNPPVRQQQVGNNAGNNGLGFGRKPLKPVNNGFTRNPTIASKPAPQSLRNPSPPMLKRPAAVQALQGHQCSSSSSSSSEYYQPPFVPCDANCDIIKAVPDTGFYSFPYGVSNTFSRRSFQVCNEQDVQLQITGCFCPGDYFEVFDNGVPIILATSSPLFPDGPNTTCTVPLNDPSQCLANDTFNHGSAVLKPGSHLLTILVGASWYTGGAGFIRLDTLCTFNYVTQPCCEPNNSCPQFIVA